MHSGTFWNILHAFWNILEHSACIMHAFLNILEHSSCILDKECTQTEFISITFYFLSCTVLYCFVLFCTVLFCLVLSCTVLYCLVLSCTVLYWFCLCASFRICEWNSHRQTDRQTEDIRTCWAASSQPKRGGQLSVWMGSSIRGVRSILLKLG